ncbi:DUF2510 domain-containing protein [Microlunatus parietis]|uniref:DUF2510 domain-containing protein n=1 Tax=Microlunatus parietis TaxID=682979 RepID=A0A7Y9IDG4_9ACTN|nr:DUF2510 domain-containing protein [Microlunatus parietis]NYE74769.1 hypothetical protein [Microlunatus parietis]
MTVPRPGWYPDPAGVPRRYRWWDGTRWTQAIGESPKAPPPDALAARLARGDFAPDEPRSGRADDDRPGAARENGGPAAGQEDPSASERLGAGHGRGADADRGWLTGYPELDDPEVIEPRRASPARMVLAITLSLTLVVAAGLGAGLVIWRDPGPPAAVREPAPGSRPPATKPATPGAAPTGKLDPKTRTASLGPATLTLPHSPYRLYADPITVPYLFQACFLANAPVHERYDGKATWSATVALAQISPDLINSTDLEKTATKAAERYAQRFFGGHATKLGRLSASDWAVDGHPGVMINFRVSYDVDGLRSRYDKVSVILVRLDDGSFIAATSSVPNDADPELAELARQSLESLRIIE